MYWVPKIYIYDMKISHVTLVSENSKDIYINNQLAYDKDDTKVLGNE